MKEVLNPQRFALSWCALSAVVAPILFHSISLQYRAALPGPSWKCGVLCSPTTGYVPFTPKLFGKFSACLTLYSLVWIRSRLCSLYRLHLCLLNDTLQYLLVCRFENLGQRLIQRWLLLLKLEQCVAKHAIRLNLVQGAFQQTILIRNAVVLVFCKAGEFLRLGCGVSPGTTTIQELEVLTSELRKSRYA